jgi:hypothetical protein
MGEYERYLELPEQERQQVCDLLSAQEKEDGSGDFVCPTMMCRLYDGCQLEECEYHIDNKWFKNCVLCYMNQEGVQKLTPTEISFLYRIPEHEVMEAVNGQMLSLRKRFLRDELETKNRITYLEGVDVCCVCECKTNSGIVRDGLRFCSPECLRRRPLYIFEIEREYGTDIGTVMGTAMALFKSIEVIESLLNLSRKKIELVIHECAGVISDKFMALLSANDFLVKRDRRSKPCARILKRMATQRSQFGSTQRSMAGLYKDFSVKLQRI